MSDMFLKIVNMSISASWLIPVVLLLRIVLKKAPRWSCVMLWGIVAIRLICPFSIESALSLIPSAETIPANIGMDVTPAIDSGISSINNAVNPLIEQSNIPAAGASVNPLQITIALYANIWVLGAAAMMLYTVVSYYRLRHKVSEAVILRDNIYQSENIVSPFVFGVFRPKIYLPYNIGETDLCHVIAHEQAHILRKDHWWKPLGFLLLTVHWFNPLMWLAYILLCRDIELACDEKVIKNLGCEQKADYTQALVSCSVNRRIIAACPLAFGEVGVKDRVKSVMNYKKPAFWVIVASIIACAAVAVCFLTNPAEKREFPINGRNVSDIDTEYILENIAKAEKLDGTSNICVITGGSDLTFAPNFDWGNDGAITYVYGRNQNAYSAQLRMFHGDNNYFLTDSTYCGKWSDQEKVFLLAHYLDALKYIPQEEIRRLSPDAEAYSVYMRYEGSPDDYERVVIYSQNGIEEISGWYIHLEVQPLYKVEGGGYSGSGDEVIHIFYGAANPLGKTYTYEGDGIMGNFTITLYNDGTFTYYEGMASSYWGIGSWKQNGKIITHTDDGHGGYGLVNNFTLDGDDLIFIEQNSDNFVYVKVKDGEKFSVTGSSFKPDGKTSDFSYLGGNKTLSLNDVIILSQKEYDLTWSDFDQYRYIETGSGLYIRVYEINEQFHLTVGGTLNSAPMYIYLGVTRGDVDVSIDIREGGVAEFIAANSLTDHAQEELPDDFR